MYAKKSQKRTMIVERVLNALKNDDIFNRLKYKQKSETELQNRMAIYLQKEVQRLYEDVKGYVPETALKRARTDFASEEDPKTTVNNFVLMGVQHRPDFTIDFDGLSIAVEIKKGDSGQSVREGIGQSIVYSSNFSFVVYLFVDCSKDNRVKNSMNGDRERKLKESLWENYNVLFDVV